MKLASALSRRADLQAALSELETRLNHNALVQEGEAPAEDPQALLKEMKDDLRELGQLIVQINRTNAATEIGGKTLTEWLAERDCLRRQTEIMRSFLDRASEKVDRYAKTEIIVRSTVPVAELRKETDALAARMREINDVIQEANWTTDLMED